VKFSCSDSRSANIQILTHHIYEFKKGIRNMVLHTMMREEWEQAEFILNQKDLSYHITPVNGRKINVFFGNPQCVNVVRSFGVNSLSDLSPEQDFILGIMLGYDRMQQCSRYMHRKADHMETWSLAGSEK
jgi:hypothetical protein